MEVLGLLLRVGCVFALLFAVLAVLKRTEGFKAARRSSPMQVLGSTRVGKGAALTIVRIGDAEYVLGVTDHNVTLITQPVPAAQPAAQAVAEPAVAEPAATAAASPAESPAASPAGTPVAAAPAGDFAAALGARLGAKLSGRDTATALGAQTPPSAGEFLKNVYSVARRRPTESTELSTDAVSAALASVTGDVPLAPVVDLPLPRDAADDLPDTPAAPPARPRLVTDGSATPTSRHALRRAVARTEALRHEEHLWTRSCRPTRSTDLDSAVG